MKVSEIVRRSLADEALAGHLDFLRRLKIVGFPRLAFARQAGARWVVRDTG